MVSDNGNDDRLTNNEFEELIQHLSVQEILTVEYRIGTTWNKLFSRKCALSQIFFCNLCVLETSSFKNLLAHIDGRKHKLQMERVKQLYHPDYTYPKNLIKETHINDKLFEGNMEENKINEGETLTSNKQTDNVQHRPDNCSKFSTRIPDEIELITCVEIYENEKGNETTRANNENNVNIMEEFPKQNSESKSNKKSFNVKPVNKESKKVGEKRLFAESYNDKAIELKKRKIVINPAAALSSKKNLAKIKEDKSEECNKKHEYQTDRIVIPTAHKIQLNSTKPSSAINLQAQSTALPNFAMKSYSSKPCDNEIRGILGVEYVIKILKNRNDISPRYECGLCELVLDGFAMQRHLEGYNHRLKFCEKHFPTAIRQYRQYMQNVPEPEIFKVMTPVLAKLAHAIERHHGRNLPYECYERDFGLNRHEILAKAFSCRHASEQYGPTFTHVVGSKEIDEFINNRQNYLPSSFSRTAIFDTKPGVINSNRNDRNQNAGNADIESNWQNRHRRARHENILSNENAFTSYMSSAVHDETYSQLKSYVHADNKNDVQPVDDETYNLMVDDFLKETLKGFSKNSLSRNRSSSPVRNFGSEKRKSLSPLRQDDIWQAYRHLVDQELGNLDERFKQYRKEPESHPSYNEEWQKFWKRRKDELVSAGLDHRNYNYQPEWVRFVKIRIEELYEQEAENLKIKARDRLCLPMTNERIADKKYHVKVQKQNLSSETFQYNSQRNDGMGDSPITSQTLQKNGPQVVSVLRLMTALEDSLGSLGPKIIDLLSKALQIEKNNPSLVNAKILNSDNCSLIEIAKEKLKGLIITGLFEGSKKKVLNQVVNDAEILLQYAYKSKEEFSLQLSTIDSSENQTKNNTSFDNLRTHINRKELASKLAASLVAQGKTDFDPSQLQQLIAVYKLIEKKKRETGGTALSNKTSFQDKKNLSDTLSDLLKPSTSDFIASDVKKVSKASHDAIVTSNYNLCSSVVPSAYGNNARSNSLAIVLQNPRDNFFDYTARSMSHTFGVRNAGSGQFDQQINYGTNYTSREQLNQQNYTIQNNRPVQNWGWSANMEANQNFNMDIPNNGFNQTPNWQRF